MEIEDKVRIEHGEMRDYLALAQFHYKGKKPGAVMAIFRAVHHAPSVIGRFFGRRNETQIVGVLVRSLPALACRGRDLATANRYRNVSQRDAAVMLNREVRTISRVVIDPQWRGLGLAVRLVRHALQHPGDSSGDGSPRFTEALAAMGHVSPFFERAGMTRYDAPPRAEHARLLDALAHLKLEPFALASLTAIRQRLNDSQMNFLVDELRRWHRAAHRTAAQRLKSMNMETLLAAARDEALFQPVYYLFDHGGDP